MYTHKYIRTHFHTNKPTYIYICTHTYMHIHTYTYIQMTEPYVGRACVFAMPCFLLPMNFLEGLCHERRQSARFTDSVPSLIPKNFLEGSCHDWRQSTEIHQFGYMTQLKRIPWIQRPLEFKFNTCHIGYNH